MSTTWVTRCPQCATAFRLNRQQLTAAAGSVRCGACLTIFKAQHHLIPGSPALPEELCPPHTKAAATQSAPAKGKPAVAANAVQKPAPEQTASAAAKTPLAPEAESPDSAAKEPDFSDAFQALETGFEQRTDHFTPEPAHHHHDGADESWAEAMLAELEQEEQPAAKEKTAPQRPAVTFTKLERDSDLADELDEDLVNEDELLEEVALEASDEAQKPAAEAGQNQAPKHEELEQQWLDDLAPEPIDLQPEPQRRLARLCGWIVLNLLVAALLVGQYSYHNFDRLARDERWRPAFALWCEQAGCRLPGIQDLARIKTGNLVVRSHERYENALSVDAVIYNTAAHPQPFPNIELLFSDLNNEPVASRIFSPREYLGGELAGERLMPSNTPIYLALEIQDPGSAALNYRLSFLPNNAP